MPDRNDISIINRSNNEYIIEVHLYGFNKEKIEKRLTSINNSPFKKQWIEFHRGTYTHQFYLSDNLYLDSLHWIRICKYLSEKGEAIVARITDKQKTYYVPAKIIEKQPNQIIVEYWVRQEKKLRRWIVQFDAIVAAYINSYGSRDEKKRNKEDKGEIQNEEL